MLFGSMPRDGGHLLLTPHERAEILRSSPEAEKYIRRYIGADDFLNGLERFCIWVKDTDAADAASIPELAARFDKVRASRLASKAESTRKFAHQPYRFVQRPHRETSAVIVPRVSSERREYVPVGFLQRDTVISDAANAIYDAEAWIFGLVQSRIHQVWLKAVAGRLESRYRYSATLVYNNFPVPQLSAPAKQALSDAALSILGVREQFPDRTPAELYDPDKMPEVLRQAHTRLDDAVDEMYARQGFRSDDDRLALLFEMYETLTTPAEEPLSA
jgi:hypothetical protein